MKRTNRNFFLFISVLLCGIANAGDHGDLSQQKSLKQELLRYELKFVENKGQMTDMNGQPVPFVFFKAQAPGIDLYVTKSGLTYVFFEMEEERHGRKGKRFDEKEKEEERAEIRYERMDLELKGAVIEAAHIVKELPEPAHFNYFYGHCQEGIYNVSSYNHITIRNIYPGIDWVLYNSGEKGFKYDFVIHPGADPGNIELVYTTSGRPSLRADGSLHIQGKFGELSEQAPYSFLKGGKSEVPSRFIISESYKKSSVHETHIKIGVNRDQFPPGQGSQDLVIDPQVTWGTFYGANLNDGATALDCDSVGNLFAIGYSGSSAFPTFNAGTFFQGFTSGSVVILKFDNTGVLKWATFYGSLYGWGPFNSIITDRQGNVFICGYGSDVTGMPLQNAGTYYQSYVSNQDAFIAKFDNNGNRLWATAYGGSLTDKALDMAVDATGNLYVCGNTNSPNFPVQNAGGYFQSSITGTAQSGFLLKFSNSGNRLWATYFGDKGTYADQVEVDLNGNIYLSGIPNTLTTNPLPLMNPGGTTWFQGTSGGAADIYIAGFSSSTNLIWSTYYGGNSNETVEGLICDNAGNLFLLGTTASSNLPVFNANTYFQAAGNSNYDLFILKFDNTGTRLWATYFGGNSGEIIGSTGNIDLDPCGNLYVSCETTSTNMPLLTPCSVGYTNTSAHSYLCRFTNIGTFSWGTYFGGYGGTYRSPIAVDNYGNLFAAGEWLAGGGSYPSPYPLVNPGSGQYFNPLHSGQDDMFFVKFGNGASNSFSYQTLCLGTVAGVSPSLSIGFHMGGAFTSTPALNIHPTTGVISSGGSAAGLYTVTYLPPGSPSTCECAVSATSTAVVRLSSVSASVAPAAACLGNSVTLISNVLSTSAVSYSWLPLGPNTPNWLLAPLTNFTYSLLVKNTHGCVYTAATSITVFPQPTVSVAGSTTGCSGDPFFLSGLGALTYYWSFGVNSPTVSFIPTSSGFIITGTDANGCTGSATVKLSLQDCVGMKEQGVTTINVYPNPASDEFMIESNSNITLSIENSLGQVLRTMSLNSGNGGKVVITGLSPGVYFIRPLNTVNSHVQKLILKSQD